MTTPKRLLAPFGALLLAAALASVAPAATTTPQRRAAGDLASATLSACVSGATAAQRSATFSAEMNAVPGTRLMSVSFDLYERTSATGPYNAVPAPGFGVWQSSNRGIASFTANENVVDLPAPGAFRAVVHFRWIGRRQRVIRRGERLTPACLITAAQPDLFITKITHAPGTPARSTELFNVTVRNSGTAAAGPFAVALDDGGTALAAQTVASLAPASATTVQFSGPRCTPGATITAQVDPSGAITEPANPARTVTLTCPTAGGASGASGATGST
jgi:hypothetical protein